MDKDLSPTGYGDANNGDDLYGLDVIDDDDATDEREREMSADDLAVLRAFDERETWQPPRMSDVPNTPPLQISNQETSDEDILLLFASEVDDDIGQMKHALSQLELDDTLDTLDMTKFAVLRRVAHKVRGTAGAMEHMAMAAIARHIETVVAQINNGSLSPFIGANALVQAVLALEVTLRDALEHGRESDVFLLALENELEQLATSMPSAKEGRVHTTVPLAELSPALFEAEERSIGETGEQDTQTLPPLPPSIRIDAQRFERLLGFSEQLAERRSPLEAAQEQVEIALHELHAAQVHLQQLEGSLADLTNHTRIPYTANGYPASSLVERMLKDAAPYRSAIHIRKLKPRPYLLKFDKVAEWDTLELERFTEREGRLRFLSDAIARVTVTSTRVQDAYANLHLLMQQYKQEALHVYTNMHLLRLTPLSVLLPRLQRVIVKSGVAVCFEVKGETTEIDKDILDALTVPLLQLLRTCIADTSFAQSERGREETPPRVWLHASALSNEVTLELGFSMTVQGGGVEAVHGSIQQLGGTVELHRNTDGGVSYVLTFPRSQGTVRGLLVRVGRQQVVIPFSQVQRVGDERYEKLDIVYRLYKLLDFPFEPDPRRRVTPIVVLPQGRSRLLAGIVVDEVVSDVDVVVKPLASHLRRAGIAGTVLDSKGNVLLLLDIPELLTYYTMMRRHLLPEEQATATKAQRTQRLVLIADDSRLLRTSLAQTLTHANYETIEAEDGLEALDKLTQTPPAIFLLDMEMPNLSGYDLLNIMRIYPELADVKVIMLTSRSSDKHKQRALDLGAHAYLVKPCPQQVLLDTIETLLHLDEGV